MNKDVVYIFGCIITVVNLITFINSLFVTIRQFHKSVKATRANDINFHFTILLIGFCFTVANGLALFRFYEAWMIKKSFSTLPIMVNGFGDRIWMFIASIGLIILSLQRIPNFIKDKQYFK